MSIASEIVAAVSDPGGSDRVVRPLQLSTSRQNQLLFFFKPECFTSGDVDAQHRLVEMSLGVLEDFACDIAGAVVLSGPTLRRLEVMGRHYGFINRFSRSASTLVTPEEAEQVALSVGATTPKHILGGHEALARWPSFTPTELDRFWLTKQSVRLRSGLYGQCYSIDGENVLLINAFHPAQLEHYTSSDRRIALLVLNSELPWRILRGWMVGDTFLEHARPGSIRRKVLERSQEFALPVVSVALNCVHLSAGPFEAHFELCNFLGNLPGYSSFEPSATNLARVLRSVGVLEDPSELWAERRVEIGGEHVPIFDLTEDLDTLSATHLIVKAGAST